MFEEMPERPVGHVLALVAGRLVRGAEVDAQEDAGVDNVVSRVRQPVIGARLLNDLRDVARECEGQLITVFPLAWMKAPPSVRTAESHLFSPYPAPR